MLMNSRPTLYTKSCSPWWWFSWYVDGRRILKSCRPLGLRPDTHPKQDVLAILYAHLGLEPDGSFAPEPGQETIGWVRTHWLQCLNRLRRRRVRGHAGKMASDQTGQTARVL